MKVDRLVSIILLLLEKERVGAQQLAELFGQGQAALAPLQRLDDPQGQYVLSPVVAP